MKRRTYITAIAFAAVALITLAAFAAVTRAEPPVGVSFEVLARGTYGAFKVRSDPRGPVDFKAKANSPIDLVVRRHNYAPSSTTGWHSHPGPVFITVTQGELTYYEYDDRTCTPHVVSEGEGFVDNGRGHVVRNESDRPAQDVSVITAPVGGPFRTNLDAPGPYCEF